MIIYLRKKFNKKEMYRNIENLAIITIKHLQMNQNSVLNYT